MLPHLALALAIAALAYAAYSVGHVKGFTDCMNKNFKDKRKDKEL